MVGCRRIPAIPRLQVQEEAHGSNIGDQIMSPNKKAVQDKMNNHENQLVTCPLH